MHSYPRHHVKDNMDPTVSNSSPSPVNPQTWTTAQSRAQFAALAHLRWHLFRNAFRRKGNIGELIARILFFPIIGIVAFFPIVSCGIGAYYIVATGHLAMLPLLTWGIFLLWQLVSINIAQPGLSFDINTIIRFPLSFPRYLAARLVFGLLSASNVIGTLALLSADIGISIAKPTLAPWSTLLLAIYALTNIVFTRMIFAWIDRWLSTRRAREALTAFIVFASLGFQYLNVTFNPGLQGRHHHTSSHLPFLLKLFHRLQPIAAVLPPGLTALSIQTFNQNHLLAAIASLLSLIAFGALFFAIYAWRMQREFQGESLSDLTTKQPSPNKTSAAQPVVASALKSRTYGLSPAVAACLQKEFIYLRRNTNQLFGFIAPIFMVFLFASRMGATGRFGTYVFPAAVAYSILGASILSYNCLGVDGTGIQLYFLAPLRMRDVFLAKNLIGFLLNLIELVLIFAVISFVAQPPSFLIGLATLCWLLFATFLNGAIGNLRSITAPKKVNLAKASRGQMSQFSALIALGIVATCFAIGFGGILLANYLQHPWLMIPFFLALAVCAFLVYLQVLNHVDRITRNHREELVEELCKN
jgi:ABC-2 type transport system permease protein